MSTLLSIRLDSPLAAVDLVDPPAGGASAGRGTADGEMQPGTDVSSAHDAAVTAALETERTNLAQTIRTLKEVTARLNEACQQVVTTHKQEIAALAVEIANKIVVQKIEDGDYAIQAIVQEALDSAPVHQDVIVHLNPQDLTQYQALRQSSGPEPGRPSRDLAGDQIGDPGSGLHLVPDPSLGRAECRIETPKGTVESFVQERLERIGQALKKAAHT